MYSRCDRPSLKPDPLQKMKNATASPGLFSLRVFCLFLSLLGCIPLSAAEPADSQIKGAMMDIEKYEAQFAGQTSSNASTVNRTLKLLGLTRERLDSSPNKSDPSWLEADARLTVLTQHLQSLANPSSANPAPGPAPTITAPQPAQPVAGAQMISQQRVRIQKLIRDIASATETMDQNGVGPFQDAAYVDQQNAILARFKESLALYSEFPNDSDVVEAAGAVSKFENMIAFGRGQAEKQLAGLGDVQAKLKALDQQLQRVPDAPQWPYEGDAVKQWLVTIAKAREAAAANLQQLAVIRERAHLPNQPGTVGEGAPYDMQDVSRLENGFRGNVARIDQSLEGFSANLDLQVSHVPDTLGFVEGLDPASGHDQSNSLLGAGAPDEMRRRLAETRQFMAVAVGYDQLLGREQLAAHTEMLARVDAAIAAFESKRARALELVRMPKAASTDKSLVSIARETLQNPDYEVGPIKRLVINTEKVHREKETSDTEFDKVDVSLSGNVTLSGTKTTWFYSWDEFQVATAEPVGNTHFIFHNTLKYFTSGATTTPLNRWILAARIQGSEIPEANINRD